ncbi:hypothetical protein HOY80DRAFT_998016 [Tuber brumale]|nr:hypothetical protein HOY80DRAFT_998016 [Tuber brumale]
MPTTPIFPLSPTLAPPTLSLPPPSYSFQPSHPPPLPLTLPRPLTPPPAGDQPHGPSPYEALGVGTAGEVATWSCRPRSPIFLCRYCTCSVSFPKRRFLSSLSSATFRSARNLSPFLCQRPSTTGIQAVMNGAAPVKTFAPYLMRNSA